MQFKKLVGRLRKSSPILRQLFHEREARFFQPPFDYFQANIVSAWKEHSGCKALPIARFAGTPAAATAFDLARSRREISPFVPFVPHTTGENERGHFHWLGEGTEKDSFASPTSALVCAEHPLTYWK